MSVVKSFLLTVIHSVFNKFSCNFPKEDERTQLLEQYRLLSLEAERFTAQTSQLETESHSMRRDLQTKEHQIRRLQEQVEVIERELQQVSSV